MPEFLELPFFSQHPLPYNPLETSYSIAQPCHTCKQRVLHHQSITACNCYRYCHEKCLIAELNAQNKEKDQADFVCTVCNRMLGVHYKMEVLTRPHVNKINITLIGVALLLLPISIYCAIVFQNDLMKQAVNSIIIFLLLGFMGFGVINSFLVREFVIVGVRSTQLGLAISAFLELEKIQEGEYTQTEMVRA